MVRGVNRDAIFLDDDDHHVFLDVLGTVKTLSRCAVLAYCLMPNHAHLMLRTDGEPIGPTMKRLGVRYAGWFNRKHDRVGHLFQDRFRSRPVDDDPYLVTLVRYIWNNPVQAGLAVEPSDYPWNSCAPGRPLGLVDDSDLEGMLPSLTRGELVMAQWEPVEDTRPTGRRAGHSADDVARLLEVTCGARTPTEFQRLDRTEQSRAIAGLRTWSVAYSAIAAATGLSRTSVQRIQARVTAGTHARFGRVGGSE